MITNKYFFIDLIRAGNFDDSSVTKELKTYEGKNITYKDAARLIFALSIKSKAIDHQRIFIDWLAYTLESYQNIKAVDTIKMNRHVIFVTFKDGSIETFGVKDIIEMNGHTVNYQFLTWVWAVLQHPDYEAMGEMIEE